VVVTKGDDVMLQKGYGYADAESKAPWTPDTVSCIGSITKQFTAAAILRLQEHGRLSVDDPLSKYFPDYPKGDAVKLRHLLTHTSGIHSYTSKPDFLKTVTLPVEPEPHIASFKNDPYDFEPGARWSYSNSGYFLLGYIVAKVSGRSYADFLKQEFFEPLGMQDTGEVTSGAILENAATGYSQEGTLLKRAVDWEMSRAGGAGSLYSTVGDLFLWNEAVFGGRVLSEASLKAAFTPVVVGSSPPSPDEGYGFGWNVGRLRGVPEIQHGGGLSGFLSQLSRYPSERLSVVVLANAAPPLPGLEPGGLARDVAQIYLSDKMESRPTPRAIAMSPEALQAFVGRYDYGQAVLTVTREGSQLFAQLGSQPRFEIFPSSENEFFWKAVDARVTFVRDGTGRVTRAVHRQGPVPLEAPRLEDAPAVVLSLEQLDAFVGKYDYGRKEAVLTVTREEGRLFAQLTGQPRFEIFPVSADQFVWKVVEAKITFVRDAAGRVTGAVHEQGGRRLDAPKLE
jgi:CubicO group peptidase (beta-lactamase class C family)